MKNLILQHFDGELRKLDKLSMNNIQQYAESIGSEYKLITGRPFRGYLTAPCQKVHMLSEEFDEYNNVLMLDIDMFAPIGMNINIFEQKGVGLYEDVQKRLHGELVRKYYTLGSYTAPYWGGAIYKMSRSMRQALRARFKTDDYWMLRFNQPYHFEDEGIMHVLAYRAGFFSEADMYLDPKWCQCSFLPNPEKAGFIHIRTKVTPQGPKREKIENYNALVEAGIL
jgi:hypothetical protein